MRNLILTLTVVCFMVACSANRVKSNTKNSSSTALNESLDSLKQNYSEWNYSSDSSAVVFYNFGSKDQKGYINYVLYNCTQKKILKTDKVFNGNFNWQDSHTLRITQYSGVNSENSNNKIIYLIDSNSGQEIKNLNQE